MKYILSVIAVCLVLITAKLYIPESNATVAGMDQFDLRMDYDFKQAVKYLFENDSDIEDALKELVIEAIENDYWVEDAIEDIIEDCRVDSIQTINC